jgi:hypothetical protein
MAALRRSSQKRLAELIWRAKKSGSAMMPGRSCPSLAASGVEIN